MPLPIFAALQVTLCICCRLDAFGCVIMMLMSRISTTRNFKQLCNTIKCMSAVRYTHSHPVKMDLSGIYPPITTPFDESENIDWISLKSNMEKWNTIPFRGYVVQGSNGEYVYMTVKERLELVAGVKGMMAEGKLLIAGSGCESTSATVQMTKDMADAGADAALVITPSFYKSGMTDEAMFAHFTRVADTSAIPIILYSVPSNTGIDLSIDVSYQVISLSAHSAGY